jgi:subtilisin
MRRRRAVILALALLIAVPLGPAVAAEPTAVPTDVAPSADPAEAVEVAPADDPTQPSEEPGREAPSATPDGERPTDDPDAPTAAPSTPPPSLPTSRGGLDPRGRFIVVLADGADVMAVANRHSRGRGVGVEHQFTRAIRGYSARLTAAQKRAIEADPDVAAVVPDEIVTVAAQHVPMGVRRVNANRSPVAAINGVDVRVDADVAIVDTGIDGKHPDLNVVGGVNCSTSDRSLWRDVQGHGTHVAGTVAALDNDFGVVGVAPGARLWAVKILNDEGFGYLSWYVCGLDWIGAQRDPLDASRPLFEAVNMSVAKWGADDGTCGVASRDILHAAICRLVGSGVTVVAAAGNDGASASKRVPAAYDEVITVSALADTDGKPGGLGGSLCYSWGTYDKDDTFADFSNYGADVDLIAPGKCIWSTKPGNRYGYSSGTSMAAPHVAGAVALYKASRPLATPADVQRALQYLGSTNWNQATDPDSRKDLLLDAGAIQPLGDFALAATPPAPIGELGGTIAVPVALHRSTGFFEDVKVSVNAPAGVSASLSTSDLMASSTSTTGVTVAVPKGTPGGTYDVVIQGTNWGRTRTVTVPVQVISEAPVAAAPALSARPGSTFQTTYFSVRAAWPAATDVSSWVTDYQVQWSVDGGAWGGTVSVPATTRTTARTFTVGRTYAARVRARDAVGNWSPWVASPTLRASVVQNTSTAITWKGLWYRFNYSTHSGGSTTYATQRGATATYTFTGRAVSLVMPKGPTRGQANIYLDNALVATVNLYRSSALTRQVVWSRAFPTAVQRTLRVEVVGTAGRPRVDIDAIVVLR